MYNLLDPDFSTGGSGTKKSSEKPHMLTQWRPIQKRSHEPDATKPTNEDACPGETSLVSPNSSIQDKLKHAQNGSTNSSVFDFVSSDEDVDRTIHAQPTRKRRKATPVRQSNKQAQRLGRKATPLSRLHKSGGQDTATTQSTRSTPVSSGSEQPQVTSKSPSLSAAISKRLKRTPAQDKGDPAQMTMSLIDSEEEVRMVSMTSSPTPPQTPVRRSPRTQRSKSSSPSAQLIEQLNRSVPFESRLTKHKNRMAGQIHGDNGVPSPSQLAMRSLRLTPEEVTSSTLEQEKNKVSLEARPLTPSRSRRRLIDALDSPRQSSIIQQINIEFLSSSAESSLNDENGFRDSASQDIMQRNQDQVGMKDEPSANSLPALSVTGSKVTYAKQRSHLSDIVLEDLSDLAVPSVAQLVEPVPNSKPPATSSYSSQISQEELLDEEDPTGGAVRSIHELRRAGENSRFQGNLDSIFEDLEAAGRTGRSRRLRGLMVLTQKFLEPTFCQRFVENGMHQRLANHALHETDVLSLTLASCALSVLLCSYKPPLKVLQHVFDSIMHSSTPLLEETKNLSKFVKAIAKDRKQNLSGAMCKDLIDFQQTVIGSQMWNINKPNELTPQLIAFRSIEIAVRGIREMKDFETSLPLQVFGQVVGILEGMLQNANIELTTSGSVLTLESAISALEFAALSRGLLEDGYNTTAERLHVLGPLLTEVEVLPKEHHDKIEQLVLRLTISVTNNNDVLCERLGQTALILAISAIVKKNFLELAEYADSGQILDEAKLESVVLALGSLINFAECSHSSRRSMNLIDDTGGSTVDWLVAAFTKRAGKASEVLTLYSRQAEADTFTGNISRADSCSCHLWLPLHAHLHPMSRS